jgi:hypothetical protein
MIMKNKLLRLNKRLKLTKRKEFVFISAILTIGFVIMQLIGPGSRFYALGFLSLATYLFSALAMRENLSGVKWFTLLVLPTLFTLSLGLFYFLLPVRWLTRIPVALGFSIGMYSILLVENIYNVAVSRSIQLLRVAHVVGFVATLATMFLLVNTVFTFRFSSYTNFVVIFLIQIPLMMQSLWSIDLSETIPKQVILYSIFFALMVGEISFVISFWPLTPVLSSLFLTLISYMLLGIGHNFFAKRLFYKNVIEYVQVFILVFIIILFTTRYR